MNRKTPGNGRKLRRLTGPALVLGGFALALGACSPQSEPAAAGATAEQPVEVQLSAAAVTGEVPAELLQAIIEDLARQENLAVGDIEVERAEEVIWPDGALGCPKPDEMYTHAQVPGYWVVLRGADKQHDYRVAAKGHFRRCNQQVAIKSPKASTPQNQ